MKEYASIYTLGDYTGLCVPKLQNIMFLLILKES